MSDVVINYDEVDLGAADSSAIGTEVVDAAATDAFSGSPGEKRARGAGDEAVGHIDDVAGGEPDRSCVESPADSISPSAEPKRARLDEAASSST